MLNICRTTGIERKKTNAFRRKDTANLIIATLRVNVLRVAATNFTRNRQLKATPRLTRRQNIGTILAIGVNDGQRLWRERHTNLAIRTRRHRRVRTIHNIITNSTRRVVKSVATSHVQYENVLCRLPNYRKQTLLTPTCCYGRNCHRSRRYRYSKWRRLPTSKTLTLPIL